MDVVQSRGYLHRSCSDAAFVVESIAKADAIVFLRDGGRVMRGAA